MRLQVKILPPKATLYTACLYSFLEIAPPTLTIEELAISIEARHGRLYPHRPRLVINKLQDSEGNDVDPSYIVDDVFFDKSEDRNSSIVRVIQGTPVLSPEGSIPSEDSLQPRRDSLRAAGKKRGYKTIGTSDANGYTQNSSSQNGFQQGCDFEEHVQEETFGRQQKRHKPRQPVVSHEKLNSPPLGRDEIPEAGGSVLMRTSFPPKQPQLILYSPLVSPGGGHPNDSKRCSPQSQGWPTNQACFSKEESPVLGGIEMHDSRESASKERGRYQRNSQAQGFQTDSELDLVNFGGTVSASMEAKEEVPSSSPVLKAAARNNHRTVTPIGQTQFTDLSLQEAVISRSPKAASLQASPAISHTHSTSFHHPDAALPLSQKFPCSSFIDTDIYDGPASEQDSASISECEDEGENVNSEDERPRRTDNDSPSTQLKDGMQDSTVRLARERRSDSENARALEFIGDPTSLELEEDRMKGNIPEQDGNGEAIVELQCKATGEHRGIEGLEAAELTSRQPLEKEPDAGVTDMGKDEEPDVERRERVALLARSATGKATAKENLDGQEHGAREKEKERRAKELMQEREQKARDAKEERERKAQQKKEEAERKKREQEAKRAAERERKSKEKQEKERLQKEEAERKKTERIESKRQATESARLAKQKKQRDLSTGPKGDQQGESEIHPEKQRNAGKSHGITHSHVQLRMSDSVSLDTSKEAAAKVPSQNNKRMRTSPANHESLALATTSTINEALGEAPRNKKPKVTNTGGETTPLVPITTSISSQAILPPPQDFVQSPLPKNPNASQVSQRVVSFVDEIYPQRLPVNPQSARQSNAQENDLSNQVRDTTATQSAKKRTAVPLPKLDSPESLQKNPHLKAMVDAAMAKQQPGRNPKFSDDSNLGSLGGKTSKTVSTKPKGMAIPAPGWSEQNDKETSDTIQVKARQAEPLKNIVKRINAHDGLKIKLQMKARQAPGKQDGLGEEEMQSLGNKNVRGQAQHTEQGEQEEETSSSSDSDDSSDSSELSGEPRSASPPLGERPHHDIEPTVSNKLVKELPSSERLYDAESVPSKMNPTVPAAPGQLVSNLLPRGNKIRSSQTISISTPSPHTSKSNYLEGTEVNRKYKRLSQMKARDAPDILVAASPQAESRNKNVNARASQDMEEDYSDTSSDSASESSTSEEGNKMKSEESESSRNTSSESSEDNDIIPNTKRARNVKAQPRAKSTERWGRKLFAFQ